MANIDSLTFDTSTWQPIEKQPYRIVWGDDVKSLSSVLSLEFFAMPPEIPVPLSNIHGIRFIYRTLANQSGAGLISAEVIDLKAVACVETIFKLPQEGRGMVYIGSITVPFEKISYVVKIQSVEPGFLGESEFTGKREAVVIQRLLESGHQIDAQSGALCGWQADPYDAEGKYPLMPNLADNESYDREFPDHALTKVRSTMRQVKQTIALDAELLATKPFTGPAS